MEQWTGLIAILQSPATIRILACFKVSDGARTRDRLDHNQELYQLSYAHRVGSI